VRKLTLFATPFFQITSDYYYQPKTLHDFANNFNLSYIWVLLDPPNFDENKGKTPGEKRRCFVSTNLHRRVVKHRV